MLQPLLSSQMIADNDYQQFVASNEEYCQQEPNPLASSLLLILTSPLQLKIHATTALHPKNCLSHQQPQSPLQCDQRISSSFEMFVSSHPPSPPVLFDS